MSAFNGQQGVVRDDREGDVLTVHHDILDHIQGNQVFFRSGSITFQQGVYDLFLGNWHGAKIPIRV